MKFNRYISKCISIFFMGLLLQKAGGSLILHDWFHTQNTTHASDGHAAIDASAYNCTCVDDFYVPFAETPAQIVQLTPSIQSEFIVLPSLPIPFSLTFFHSLRGPPSITS